MKIDYTIEQRAQCGVEISHLRQLLGEDVVLLPCDGKRPVGRWKERTSADMSNDEYLEKLSAAPNIGVVLGKRSGGLCVIDFDVEGEDEKFLAANPDLAGTLRTRGSRGSSFWVRIHGDFPSSVKLKLNGAELGEWRADGNQSIISGLHPKTHRPYRVLNRAEPVRIAFDKINLPVMLISPLKPGGLPLQPKVNLTHVTEGAEVTHGAEATEAVRVFELVDLSDYTEDEIVRLCLPIKAHQNHQRLFDLARGVKTLERKCGRYTDRALERIFGKWFRLSRPHLRGGQTRKEYMEEFLQSCDTAKIGLDEGGLMTAWQMAKKLTPPPAALNFRSSAARLLIGLCHQLQQLVGDKDFFLSCYSAGKLLKVTPPHTSSLLRTLVDKGVLQVVEKGHTGKATRYRYLTAQKPKEIVL